MEVIKNIIEKKLSKYYESKNYDNKIITYLSVFDILSLVSVLENKKIKDILLINRIWRLLHSKIFEKCFVNNINKLNREKKIKVNLDDDESINNFIKTIPKKDFNNKFKLILEQDEDFIRSNKVLKNYIQHFQFTLTNYLNKLVEEKIRELPKEIVGDLGVSQYDVE